MTKAQVELILRKLIIDCLNLDVSETSIKGENLIDELGINSIDALEIFLNIENEFDFQIPDDDLNAQLLENINYLTNYVYERCDL